MRRYLAQAAASGLTIFAVIWLYVVFWPMAFLDDEFPRWSAKQAMLDACHLGDLVVVGDSRAAVDIMPNFLPVRATNLALAGTSTVETYVAVKRLLRCADLPRVVVISISASHFAGPDTFWQKSALYRFLGWNDLQELRHSSAQLNDWSIYTLDPPDDLPPWARNLLYSTDFPSIYFAALLQNEVVLHDKRNRTIYRDVLASRGQYFFHELPQGYDGVAAEGRMPRFTVLPILDRYFDRMLEVLAAKNIRAVFLPMPVNDATYNATTPEFRAGFDAYLRSHAASYKGFVVPADTMPHLPNRLIGDDLSHLNQAGAAIFNRDFVPCAAALVRQADFGSCMFMAK